MIGLGLDIGSSSIKGAVLDLEAQTVGPFVREPFPGPIGGLPTGWFEIDPLAVVAAARRALDQLRVLAPTARAVLACGQMGGVVLVEPTMLRPLTNYLSWRDQRTEAAHPRGGTYLDAVMGRWSEAVFSELGRELKAGSTTSLLFWLAENQQLPRAAIPASIGDFVLGQLCGVPPRMERTMAIGLLDLRSGDWHRPALAALGLDRLDWPRPANAAEPIGTWRAGPVSLPCYPVLGDQLCALHGVGLAEGDLSLNVSTGAQVSRVSRSLEPGDFQSRHGLDGQYLDTITHLPGGRSLNVLVDLATELARSEGHSLEDPWGTIARAAAASTGGGLTCDLRFFSTGQVSAGRIDQITTENLTIGNLFHAAFRSMAETYAVAARRLAPGHAWPRVLASGGLIQRLPVLQRLIEEQFGVPLQLCHETEETFLGLLRQARQVLGPRREGGERGTS